MPKIETILWTDLFGNKLLRALDPAMLVECGCVKQQRVKPIGANTKSIYNVLYDRDYAVEYIFRKLCKPLFVLGREKVLALVAEAWDIYYSENYVALPSQKKTTKVS